MKDIQIGDRVSFTSSKGHGVITGTVTDEKISRPGSRNKRMQGFISQYGLAPIENHMFVVLPDGGGGVWRVPADKCKKIGVSDDVQGSINKVRDFNNQRSNQIASRAAAGREKAGAGGFYDLNKGDAIEVQIRGRGWTKAKFSHLTHSGKVGLTLNYRGDDKVIFSHAEFVRMPSPAAPETPPPASGAGPQESVASALVNRLTD